MKKLEELGFTEYDNKWWKGDYRLHQPRDSKGWWIVALVDMKHGCNLRWARYKTLAASLRVVETDAFGPYRKEAA